MSPKNTFAPFCQLKSFVKRKNKAEDASEQTLAQAQAHPHPQSFEQLEPRQLLAAFVVDISADENDGVGVGTGTSLREAITAANLNAGADQITFAASVNSPIVLTGSYLTITDDVTITATPAQNITVDGNNATSHFVIGHASTTVTIDGVDLVNGNNFFSAGSIFSRGDLTIRNSTISGNTGFNAGAIRNVFGQLLIENTTISNNSAQHSGGIRNSGQLQLVNSTIMGNNVTGRGGGIVNDGGTILMTGSSVSNNHANLNGGGIYNALVHGAGDLTITDSTISGNTSGLGGGGISNTGATLNMTGSTVSGNSTSGTGVLGGGIRNYAGTVTLSNSTISGNQATGTGSSGGGIYSSDFLFGGALKTGVLDMTNVTVMNNQASTLTGGGILKASGNFSSYNSIVAANTASGGDSDITGVVTSGSHNLIGHAGSSGGLTDGVNGNIVGNSGAGTLNLTNVINTALANNGGPTETHALLRGGLAVDAGSDVQAVAAGLTTDQRGQTRFFATTDIGAYELDLSTLIIDNPVDEDDTDYSIGDLSLREGLRLASANPLIHTLQVSNSVTQYDLYASLSYTGTQDLNILGGGLLLKTLPGLEGTFDIFISDSSGGLTLQDMTIQDGRNGVTVNVPAGSLGDVRLSLANVLVQNNSQYGVYMNDTLFATDAGLHFQSFISQFANNGNGAATAFDGVRLDDRGLGNIRADVDLSAFVQNGGDGLEIEEQNDGLVEVYMEDSFFYQNGYFSLATPDDGLDVEENDNGSALIDINNTTFDNHADVGIDIAESGAGSFAVTLTDVTSNFNTDDNVKIDETGDGDLIAVIDDLTANQSINGSGVNLNEAGAGNLNVTADDVTADGNTLTGLSLTENDLGHLFVQLDMISTQFNGDDGISIREFGNGDLIGAAINVTTVGNGAYGVKLLQDQLAGDIGTFTLYYLAFANTLGPITTTAVVVTP